MPKRIPFHVVYATSEDVSYPACELNSQGPAARGWRSQGAPPHELLLRLTSVASVHKLQLLAHHQLIPSSVEVLVSGGLMAEGAATPCGAAYTSVGRVSLARPAAHARTRELRSAALPEPTVARFVKLRLSAPHPPGKEDDQVALMAVNVLGDELPADPSSPGRAEPTYSPYDDLAFVMYVDNEIADLVRELDERKRSAVTEERFEYARRLKSAGTALTAAGARIGRWRLRKRTAAARDDFELARQLRDRISDAMEAVKGDEGLLALLEVDGPDPKNDTSLHQDYDFSFHLCGTEAVPPPAPPAIPPAPALKPPSDDEGDGGVEENGIEDDERKSPIQELPVFDDTPAVEEVIEISLKYEEVKEEKKRVEEDEMRRETESPRRSITPNASNGGVLVRRRNKSAGPRSTYEAYEERPIPALRHSHTNEYLANEECSVAGSGVGSGAGSGAGSAASAHVRPHKLNEKERKAAALPILIFGYPLVEKFYSKSYLDKEEGLNRLKSILSPTPNSPTPTPTPAPSTSPNKSARAAAALLQRALRDKVFSVFGQANEVCRALFRDFMPDRVCAAEVGRCVERILPELLRASGDPAPRVHSTAMHTVLTIADCPCVRSLHVIPQQLVRPVAAAMHPRLALSRLQMVEQLLQTHGIATDKNSGLTVRRLAECGAAGTQHASGAVRAAAERILLAAYQRSPRVVRAQLPPDDAVTRRNLIYRHLFQQFDKLDMQKILNNAASEDPPVDNPDSVLETSSISLSTRSGTTISSSFMTSSLGAAGSSYSLKSAASNSTLAPSSLSGSFSSSRTKSSMKRPLKKYTPKKPEFGTIGYNKLRLDSAVSPKHSPKTSGSNEKEAGCEKPKTDHSGVQLEKPMSSSGRIWADDDQVHFQESKTDEVVLRRTNRNQENRHSMIHYDHENSKPQLKERPLTVYEPLHIDYRDSPSLGSPKISRNDVRSADSLTINSPQCSNDLEYRLDSPKRTDFFKELDSPKLVSGIRKLHLDESANQMDESGYYSPGDGRRVMARRSGDFSEHFDGSEGGVDGSSGGTTPEPVCNTQCAWCGSRVRAGALDAHCWRRCVLLARCSHCRAALEARALHHHLLQECTMSNGAWKQCRKCGAALRAEDNEYHVNCIPLGPDEWKCPYCLTNVLARDLPWQRHLTQCPRNPRVTQHS